MLTAQYIRALLHYDPITGVFTWLKSSGSKKAGQPAGSDHSEGYRQVKIDGTNYLAHRLAWLYQTGLWPENEVDHRDGQRQNNQWMNLRAATHLQNHQNRARNSNNTSGYPGVFRQRGKWVARIRSDSKFVWLGYFDDVIDAAKAYARAKIQLHQFNPVIRNHS